jgi:dihydroflavonol-4-reductase
MLEKQISITGGSGHLGTCLIELLLEKGFIVKALYRNYKPSITHSSLTWIKGDLTNKDVLKELVTDASVLIHCASIISVGENNKEDVYHTNVLGTENVVNTCLHTDIKFIYISSSNAVEETINNEVFNENRPYKTKNDFLYAYTKALSEQMILKAVSNNHLNAIIIRPTSIIGPPDFKPSHFGKTILDIYNKRIPALTTGGYDLVDIRDLSETIINSFQLGKKGEVYLVGGNYYSLKQIAKIINPNHRFLYISLNVLIFLFPLIKVYDSLFPLEWPITYESLKILKKAPKHVDSSKAIKELKHTNRPIEQTLTDLINWFNKETSS